MDLSYYDLSLFEELPIMSEFGSEIFMHFTYPGTVPPRGVLTLSIAS